VPVDNLASILVTEYYEGTKLAFFIIRAFYGARRPYAYRWFSVEAEETFTIIRFI
jgi:hypothetical protein